MNDSYIKKTRWLKQYQDEEKSIEISTGKPELLKINHGFILPTKDTNDQLSWGMGGVLDSNCCFVDMSGIPRTFGGAYSFESNIKEIDETVIFLGIIPKQIGHFMIDSICRMWLLLDDSFKHRRIAYCSFYWDDNPLEGKIGETFELLGVDKSRLIHVVNPMKFKEIIIPEPTMTFGSKCNKLYVDIIKKLIDEANRRAIRQKLVPISNIYFNKRFYFPANMKQVGEKEIEKIFQQNGYVVMSPEKMTMSEMIFYVNHCDKMACLSGTTSHYSIFSSKEFELISLNRLPEPLKPQMRIDKLFKLNNTYIDVFNDEMLKEGNEYGKGVIWVEITDELKKYIHDNDMCFTNRSILFTNLSNRIEYVTKQFIYRLIPFVKKIIGR